MTDLKQNRSHSIDIKRFIDAPLIDEVSANEVFELVDEFNDSYTKRQQWRTETEIRFSVLNDGKYPTPAAKYWQAVREQSVFIESVIETSFEYRKKLIDKQEIQSKFDTGELGTFELARLEIEADEIDWKLAQIELAAKDRVRELLIWSRIKHECIKADPDFDTTSPNTHQKESLKRTLENRRDSLTPGSSQAEVLNVIAPLMSIYRSERFGDDIDEWWEGVSGEGTQADLELVSIRNDLK